MRDYKNNPLKKNEAPSYEDLYELYINRNMSKKEVGKYIGKITYVKYLDVYGIKKDNASISKCRKNTNNKKYGVDNISQLQKIKDKKEETSLLHYGFTNPNKSNLVKNKVLQTKNKDSLNIIIPENKIIREFEIIKQGKENGYSTGNNWNEIVLYFQWKEFYKKEIEMWNENKIFRGLPLRSWIYNNRLKHIGKGFGELTDREILRAFKISGIYYGNSFHSPFWIQEFIKEYNIKSILDPCGGWGHRLLGAYNIKYIYNDINKTTYENCIKICNYFDLKNKYFYNEDSSTIQIKEDYEAIFTCPPYASTEKYSDKGAENLNFSNYISWWNNTVKNTFLNKDGCKYFAFIINHKYIDTLIEQCLNLGLTQIKKIRLGSEKNLTHFQRISNSVYKGEYLVVFTKN